MGTFYTQHLQYMMVSCYRVERGHKPHSQLCPTLLLQKWSFSPVVFSLQKCLFTAMKTTLNLP